MRKFHRDHQKFSSLEPFCELLLSYLSDSETTCKTKFLTSSPLPTSPSDVIWRLFDGDLPDSLAPPTPSLPSGSKFWDFFEKYFDSGVLKGELISFVQSAPKYFDFRVRRFLIICNFRFYFSFCPEITFFLITSLTLLINYRFKLILEIVVLFLKQITILTYNTTGFPQLVFNVI
jgi:hypothetical protein